ncbi:hypothetical protein ACLB2K_063046 [Fragaria x ananassa]
MESQKKMMVVYGLVAAVFLQSAAAQTVHVHEEGTPTWNIPQNGAQDYVTWASSQTFVVGDILIFNFATNAHDVVEVPKASFDSCSSTNAIGNSIITGPANVTLASPGEHYYICTVGKHCQSGQKLAISVSDSTTPGVTAEPPSSSPAVQAGLVLCLLSLVMGFFF